MKLLYGVDYLSVDAAALLAGRLQHLAATPGVELDLFFGHDLGGADLLRGCVDRCEAVDRWRFREAVASSRHDAIVLVDAPEYLDAAGVLAEERCTVLEVQETDPAALHYLSAGRGAEGVVVPSRHLRRVLQKEGVVSPRTLIEVAPVTVDPAVFFATPTKGSTTQTLGWVGSLSDAVARERCLLVMTLLADRRQSISLWMVGGAHCSDAQLEAFLESIDGLGLSERVRWFPTIERAAMRKFYGTIAASGGCLLSTSDRSAGREVVEALLCACPVVARSGGAVAEVAPGADYLQLYEEIEEAVSAIDRVSEDIRVRLQADQVELRARFAPEATGSQYLRLLAKLIERHRRTSA